MPTVAPTSTPTNVTSNLPVQILSEHNIGEADYTDLYPASPFRRAAMARA